MSKITVQKITCPKCSYKGELKMFDSANVSLNHELREKVLSGDIFRWTCPKCGENITILHNLLYHDMKNEFQVYYSPNDCAELNKTMNSLLKKMPGARKTIRTVESLNALREKILIFEEGLNDIAIELIKALIKFDSQNDIPDNTELRFISYISKPKDGSTGKLLFNQIENGQPQKGFVLYPKDDYDKILADVLTDDKFKMNLYCDTINESWILERIIK